jgi:DNA-binding response OmpR family regulator
MQTFNKIIILVENNRPMLELYQRELSRVFQVLVFSDVEGVMEAIQVQEISAVILNAELPSEKGWQLLKTIKQGSSLPVILCGTLDARKRAMEAKADAYLLEPVSPAVLVETLTRICGM